MEKLNSVKLKVAIGFGGGGCVVEMIEGNSEIKTDLNEYGSHLDDLFYNSEPPPEERGIYLFTGATYGIPGADEMPVYRGEFSLITHNCTGAVT